MWKRIMPRKSRRCIVERIRIHQTAYYIGKPESRVGDPRPDADPVGYNSARIWRQEQADRASACGGGSRRLCAVYDGVHGEFAGIREVPAGAKAGAASRAACSPALFVSGGIPDRQPDPQDHRRHGKPRYREACILSVQQSADCHERSYSGRDHGDRLLFWPYVYACAVCGDVTGRFRRHSRHLRGRQA